MKPKNAERLADFVAAVHFVAILLLLSGGLWIMLFPASRVWFIALYVSAFFSQMLWGMCPLTVMENRLRALHDHDAPQMKSFIATWFRKRFDKEIPLWLIPFTTMLLFAFAVVSSFVAWEVALVWTL